MIIGKSKWVAAFIIALKWAAQRIIAGIWLTLYIHKTLSTMACQSKGGGIHQNERETY